MKIVAAALLVIAAAFLLFASSNVDAVNPGFKVSVTQNGLNYAHSVGLLYLKERLANKVITVPDQSGEKDSFEYTVSNIQIAKINIPAGSATLSANQGISISTTGLSAELTANWHVREKIWPHPSGSGNAQIDIASTSASSTIKFGVSPNGHPTSTAENTGASIGSVTVHFSGSRLDFLLNLLKHVFEDIIKKVAEQQMGNEINSEVDGALNTLLANWPLLVKFGTVAEIDYSLVAQQVITSTYMTLPMKGEVFPQDSVHTEAPYVPAPLPDPTGGGAMAQIFLGSYVLNTGGFTYYKTGKLALTVTPAEVPPASPIQLNTSFWQSIVPELYKAYPNLNMQLAVSAVNPPDISFSSKLGVKGLALVDIAVQVIQANQAKTAFTVRVNTTGDATLGISGNKITGKITFFNASFALASSNIGPFNPTQLYGILMFAIEGIIVPYINNYLTQGFPVPALDGLQLVNPTVAIQDGYMAITTNFSYPNPQSSNAVVMN